MWLPSNAQVVLRAQALSCTHWTRQHPVLCPACVKAWTEAEAAAKDRLTKALERLQDQREAYFRGARRGEGALVEAYVAVGQAASRWVNVRQGRLPPRRERPAGEAAFVAVLSQEG